MRLLPPEHFPRPVAQRGRALLIEWMPDAPPSP
jgi:hypothetical protein